MDSRRIKTRINYPEFEAELDAETIDSLYGNFNKLFTYFNEKKEWTSFIKKLGNCKITDDSKLLKYNSDADFKDFFNKGKYTYDIS